MERLGSWPRVAQAGDTQWHKTLCSYIQLLMLTSWHRGTFSLNVIKTVYLNLLIHSSGLWGRLSDWGQ